MKLTRRRFLRAAGGAALALPALSMFSSISRADTPLPRLLVYYLPNGRRREWWVPSANGGLTFPASLSALQPFANRALSITDLWNTAASNSPGAAHAMGTGTLLTGTAIPTVAGGVVHNNISFDQILARELAPDTRFASLQWSSGEPGVCDVGGSACAYTQSVSWSGPRQPMLPTLNPHAAFTRLFGDGAADGLAGRAADIRRQSVGSVLDLTREEAGRFEARLGADDRETFQQYRTALAELEASLLRPPSACGADETGPSPTLTYPERVPAFHELIKLAFQCDQTRIITFMIEFGLSLRSHDFLGAPGGHHVLTHDLSQSALERLERVERWQAQMLADMLTRLDSTPTAAGRTLLDDTMVLVVPSMGEGASHDHTRVCPLIFGGTGFVATDGRQVNGAQTSLANLFVTLLAGFGVEGSFGAGGAKFGDDGESVLSGIVV